MPGQFSNEAHVRISIPLIRYLQRESLTALEQNLVLYIIEHSLNFKEVRNHGQPMWVEISPSRYASEFGHSRVSVSRAIARIAYLGIMDSTQIKRDGQLYRHFKIIDSDRMGKVLADLSHINTSFSNRKKPENVTASLQSHVTASLQSIEVKSNVKSLACIDARYGHVSMRDTAMYRCAIRPCIDARYTYEENSDKFQGVKSFQECINNIKNYINNISKFSSPSYMDIVLPLIKTKRERTSFNILLRRSIDLFGLFSVWVSVNEHLLNESLNLGNFEAISTILKNHKTEIDEKWNTILTQIDNMFFDLTSYESTCISKMIDFNSHAQIFLTTKRTEKKSLIFLFDSFESMAVREYSISNSNIDSFREKIVRKMNLYFKSKIYGERELIHEEIKESFMDGGI